MIVYFTLSMVLNIMLSFWDIVKTLESSGEIFWSVAILFVADNWHVKVDVKHVKDIWASIFNKKLAPHKRKMHELSSCPPCVIACDDSISSSQNIFFDVSVLACYFLSPKSLVYFQQYNPHTFKYARLSITLYASTFIPPVW